MNSEGVLVVGGSSGIGLALVHRLVAAQLTVVSFDRDTAALPSAVLQRKVDLSNSSELESALVSLGPDFRFTGVAAVAGTGFKERLGDLTPELFRRQLDANVGITYAAVRACWPRFAQRASVVTVSSLNACGGDVGAGYAAGKAAIIGLSKALALELAPQGVRVNTVMPGPVDTPMLQKHYTPRERQLYAQMSPLGLSQPDDVASVIQFLLSASSSQVTGQVIVVDGGLSLAYHPVF